MTTDLYQKFAHHIKQCGYSITSARKTIFMALEQSSPLSVSQLYETVCNKVDRSTIYRTIGLFEDMGIVKKIHIGWKDKVELSDQYSRHHHHITCSNCNKIFSIEADKTLEKMVSKIAYSKNVKPTSHQFEIIGLCGNCRTDE